MDRLERIDALSGATLRAPAGVLVRAYAGSYTIIPRGSVAIGGRAIIDAEAGSLTIAGPGSTVFASKGARVIALRGSNIWMEPGADVVSYGATVDYWSHSSIRTRHTPKTKQLVECLALVVSALFFSIWCGTTGSLLAALGLAITILTGLVWLGAMIVSRLQARKEHDEPDEARPTYTICDEPVGQLDRLLDREIARLRIVSR